jgi:hypothetical protein
MTKKERRALNQGMTKKEYAEMRKRHRKWPLGTVVIVDTPTGKRMASISRHMRQEGNRAQADVTFPECIDLGTANGYRLSHPIPFRCMKKATVLAGISYWYNELGWLQLNQERNRLQIMVAQDNLKRYRNALFTGTTLAKWD